MKSSPSPAEVRAILAERLDILLAECDQVMDNAAFGQTLNDLDDFLLVKGRNFIKEVLQQKMQERIERTETSPEAKQSPCCKKKRKSNIINRKR
ncbi:MAG: hypothetical protein FWC43_11345 [Planctomycetaceae bacterium]|nr:hypothetical protein [Planctomycetaceae bacterium]